MTIFGVDVDQGRGTIDWPKVAASGIRFAIIRCVREGDLGVDASYARNVSGARAAGITPGAYCFLSGSGRAATQASLFIRTIGDPTGMLIALDVERGALTPTAADVRTFAAAWRAVWPNHPLLIYGSRGSTLGSLGTLADLGPLWLAAYPRIDHASAADLYALSGGRSSLNWISTFGGWKGPAIWQFASTGVVPGISGSVDIDAIETADLAALTGEDTMAGLGWKITAFEGGIVTIKGVGHSAVRLRDGVYIAQTSGTSRPYAAKIALDVQLPGGIAGADRRNGYLIGGDVAILLASDVTAVPNGALVPKAPVTVTVMTSIDSVIVNSFTKAV